MGNLKSITLLLSLFLSLFLLTSCGQGATEVLEKRPQKNEKTSSGELVGQLPLTNGATLQLKELQKTSVLFFVSESCLSCIEETKNLVQLFQQKGRPQNVQFISVLIGSTLPDTIDWLHNYSVPWIVGYDESIALYKSYFQLLVTPSMIIYQPQLKRYNLYQGKKSIQEIEQETGAWEY